MLRYLLVVDKIGGNIVKRRDRLEWSGVICVIPEQKWNLHALKLFTNHFENTRKISIIMDALAFTHN